MASPQAAAIDNLFDSFVQAMADNPNMELDELRDLLEKCGDLAADPGGVDMVSSPSESTCITCHDGVKDEGRFDLSTYLPKVQHSP